MTDRGKNARGGEKTLFVLGDSISLHYGPALRRLLKGTFRYDRKRPDTSAEEDLDNPLLDGANGGDSSQVLACLRERKEAGKLGFDLILLNCGLHDIKTNPHTGAKQVPLPEYEANLLRILDLLKRPPASIVWVRTTPVDDQRHNRISSAFHRFNPDVVSYNECADRIMAGRAVPVIDLYGFVKDLGPEVYCDHVHYTEPVRYLQAVFIAGFLQGLSGRPLPA